MDSEVAQLQKKESAVKLEEKENKAKE